MLYTKFQGHRSIGSGEEDFKELYIGFTLFAQDLCSNFRGCHGISLPYWFYIVCSDTVVLIVMVTMLTHLHTGSILFAQTLLS